MTRVSSRAAVSLKPMLTALIKPEAVRPSPETRTLPAHSANLSFLNAMPNPKFSVAATCISPFLASLPPVQLNFPIHLRFIPLQKTTWEKQSSIGDPSDGGSPAASDLTQATGSTGDHASDGAKRV